MAEACYEVGREVKGNLGGVDRSWETLPSISRHGGTAQAPRPPPPLKRAFSSNRPSSRFMLAFPIQLQNKGEDQASGSNEHLGICLPRTELEGGCTYITHLEKWRNEAELKHSILSTNKARPLLILRGLRQS